MLEWSQNKIKCYEHLENILFWNTGEGKGGAKTLVGGFGDLQDFLSHFPNRNCPSILLLFYKIHLLLVHSVNVLFI